MDNRYGRHTTGTTARIWEGIAGADRYLDDEVSNALTKLNGKRVRITIKELDCVD